MTSAIHFYNPREAPPEVLETMFVGRDALVERILGDLSLQNASQARRHWLVRGPRGSGKTHLMGIVYYRVRRDPDLHRTYLPVWLPENEAYSVYSTAYFLLQVAEALVKELRAEEAIEAAELKGRLRELETAGDDRALFDTVATLVAGVSERLGKTILVLLENLEVALEGFPGDRDEEAALFEQLLAERTELLFLASTSARYLPPGIDGREPLLDSFQQLRLAPLSEQQLGELFPRLARVTGQIEKAQLAGADPQGSQRRRVLHRLTGGNPRAVVMAFSVVSTSGSVSAMVDGLTALLDAQTAYFEARLAQLAPRARTIVTQMALARENLTLAEIARRTRLGEPTLSAELTRLVEEGHAAPVSSDGDEGVLYELRDGLFRLWFQYRRGRKVLRPLVRFLAFWHPVEELERALDDLRAVDLSELGPLELEPQRAAEWQLRKAIDLARKQALGESPGRRTPAPAEVDGDGGGVLVAFPRPETGDGAEAGATELLEARARKLRETLASESASRATPARIASARRELGLTLLALERHEEAIDELRALIDRFFASREPEIEELVVRTTFDLITAFAQLGCFRQALGVCDDFLSRAAGRRLGELQEPLARTIFHLGATLGQLGRIEEAMEAYQSLLHHFDTTSQPGLEVLVARATFSLGHGLWQLGRYRQALEVSRELAERFAGRSPVSIREQVAAAMLLEGLSLHKTSRPEAAVAVYRELLERFGGDDHQGLRAVAASAAAALGLAELQTGETAAAGRHLSAWTEAIAAAPELDAGPLGPCLKLFLECFELGLVRRLLETLATIEDPDLAETARFYRQVLDVVEAAETSSEEEVGKGTPSRVRFALARVPPELRKTVEELAESVLATRHTGGGG